MSIYKFKDIKNELNMNLGNAVIFNELPIISNIYDRPTLFICINVNR